MYMQDCKFPGMTGPLRSLVSGTGVGEFSDPLRGHQTFRSSEKRDPAFNVHTQGASTKFGDFDWIQYVVIFMDISWVFNDKFDSLGSYTANSL